MLSTLQNILQAEQFQCSIEKKNGLEERLLVLLSFDSQQREQLLEITAREQMFNQDNEPVEGRYFHIQFTTVFPFHVKEGSLTEVSSLLHFLNQSLDMPGLELNELENQVRYRYVWLVKDSGIDAKLVLSIIGLIMLFLELFSEPIEYLASGKATFNELLEQVSKLLAPSKQE